MKRKINVISCSPTKDDQFYTFISYKVNGKTVDGDTVKSTRFAKVFFGNEQKLGERELTFSNSQLKKQPDYANKETGEMKPCVNLLELQVVES